KIAWKSACTRARGVPTASLARGRSPNMRRSACEATHEKSHAAPRKDPSLRVGPVERATPERFVQIRAPGHSGNVYRHFLHPGRASHDGSTHPHGGNWSARHRVLGSPRHVEPTIDAMDPLPRDPERLRCDSTF